MLEKLSRHQHNYFRAETAIACRTGVGLACRVAGRQVVAGAVWAMAVLSRAHEARRQVVVCMGAGKRMDGMMVAY